MSEMFIWSVRGVNPWLHRQYRAAYYKDEGKLNGVYSEQLFKDLYFLSEVLNGNIELEGDNDLEDYVGDPVRHTHELERCTDIFLRKNESNDLSRLNLRRVPSAFVDAIEVLCKKLFGRYYSNRGHFINIAMNLRLKLRSSVTKVSESSRCYAERVLKGDVTSPLHVAFNDLEKKVESGFEAFDSRFDRLEKMIIESKPVKMAKKSFKLLKRGKRVLSVVDNLKRINRTSFSEGEYAEMVDLQCGIGDLRTVRGDLQAAVRRKLVVMKYSRYYFVDNMLYDSVQGAGARLAFNQQMKEKLQGKREVTLEWFKKVLNDLTGLFDDESVMDRLEGLITMGWLTPFCGHVNTFNVHLD